MNINYSIEIARPADVVFPWLAKPENAMQWMKSVKKEEIIVEKPGMVGTTFKEEMEEDGNKLEITGVVTKFVENKLIGFHLESRIHRLDVDYAVEEHDGQSRVSVETAITWKFPMSVISLFMGSKIKNGILEQTASEFGELKKLCETC
jgi:uncharacterized protein YndB with AHSA1/START domain